MAKLELATSCPKCGSSDIRTKSRYTRNVRTLHGVEKYVVRQCCCRKCQTTFTDGVNGVKKGCQIAEDVKVKAVDVYIEGPDLEGVRKRLIEDLNVAVSTATIWRSVYTWSTATQGFNPSRSLNSHPSRYICADEKFISVHGKKKPQFFAVCPECNLVMKQKLLRNRDEPPILRLRHVDASQEREWGSSFHNLSYERVHTFLDLNTKLFIYRAIYKE